MAKKRASGHRRVVIATTVPYRRSRGLAGWLLADGHPGKPGIRARQVATRERIVHTGIMALKHPDRPPWLKVRFPAGGNYERLQTLMREQALRTVCEEARCPNIGDCWSRGTATFMILGDTCTRSCGFCAVKTGRPGTIDAAEPRRVALAIQKMGLRHAVI